MKEQFLQQAKNSLGGQTHNDPQAFISLIETLDSVEENLKDLKDLKDYNDKLYYLYARNT